MPNERALFGAALRGGYEPPPYATPGRYADPRGSTIGDLIGYRGRAQADAHMASSNMLAQGVQQASQQIAQGITAHAEQKEMAKRDAATMKLIEGWDGQNPMELFAGLQKVRPHDALQYTNTVLALRKGPQKDPEQELARFGKIAQFLKDQPDDVVARAWPKIRQSIGSTAEQLGLGAAEQWDPSYRGIVAKVGELWGPKQEGRKVGTLSPGAVAFDETTGEIIAKGPEKTEPRRLQTLSPGQTVIDEATGAVVASAAPAPREPKDEQLVQVDVNGVATWMPKSQAAGKPAAQAARAVTGAERQSLAFYNRGKQALDDIAPLEEGITGKNLAGQARLQFAPNWLQSKENQQYRQAQRAFTEARLRKESGAAIPEGEYENDARTYFAQPGDTSEVLAQKRAGRQRVLDGIGYASGKAYEEHYGEPLATPARGGERGPIRPIPDKPKQPKAGDVVRGYRYVGGNPADQKSWQKVQ